MTPTPPADDGAAPSADALADVSLAQASLPDARPLEPDNPLAAPSTLPYGLPDFQAIRTEHLAPAIAEGLAEQRAEWNAVANEPEAPTVANTLEALERSGRLLGRALAVFHTLVSARATEDLYALEAEVAPALSAHWDAYYLDPALAGRIEALHRAHADHALDLEPETAWLLHRYRTAFRRAGAGLGESDKARLRDLNGEITSLETAFSQAVVAGMEAGAVVVEDVADLAGLGHDAIAALERNARDRGRDGYLVTLKLPTPQGILDAAQNRDLRRRVLEASVARGSGVDADSDTRETILRLARLRHERARLLGYPHHAAYIAEDATARTTEAVVGMLARLAPPALRNARAEAQDLRAALEQDHPGAILEPWDWAFYAERVRRERYAFDDGVLRPYLDAERVLRDGVFFAATRLYGITFDERGDLAGHSDGVRVFEVREADGTGLGLFVLDLYARAGKRGGAWMTSLVHASALLGEQPVVTNTLNVDRPPAGTPTLLSWDQVNTLFHEFGHALHGLFSTVRYPSLSGTAVPRDFVEYPSQVNEMWATDPEVLASYARHHATGEPLDPEVAERLRTSQQHGEGFRTLEYLAAALVDQAWHVGDEPPLGAPLPTTADGVAAFEAAALERAGVAYAPVPPRYRSTYFNHAFGGGYDAAYYSYIWSEVLDADTVDWFGANGGLDAAAGRRFREALLSRGHAQDPMASFRDLRGRDPVIEPLLARRGLS